jgi:Dolichyl-phosphate-mannose-protein mannosyltransferase
MMKTGSSQFLDRLFDIYAFHLVCIFFVMLVVIKILLSLSYAGPFIFPDETVYNSVAQNIVHGKLYGKFGAFSPGYPFLLSLAYHIFNNQNYVYHLLLAISAFVTSTIIFPSYFILEKYCSKVVSVLGSITVSTLTVLNFYSFTLMTEALFIPLFLFSIWFILKSYETNNKKWALYASLSTVYLYVTRSTGLAMLIAFVLTYIP